MQQLILFLQGILVGVSYLVPGFSGSTMALLLGLYERLIYHLNQVFSLPVKGASWKFFFLFGLGVLTGGAVGSRALLLLFALPKAHFFLLAFFFFLAAESLKEASLRAGNALQCLFYGGVGWCLAYFLTLIPPLTQAFSSLSTYPSAQQVLILAFTGAASAATMLIPGVSGSLLLFTLGLYPFILEQVSTGNWPFLFPLGLGGLGGIFLTQGALNTLLFRHRTLLYALISGFLVHSLYWLIRQQAREKGGVYATALILCALFLWLAFRLYTHYKASFSAARV